MGKKPESEFYKKKNPNDQETYESLLTSSSHQGNENQDHNTISLYIYRNSFNEKDRTFQKYISTMTTLVGTN